MIQKTTQRQLNAALGNPTGTSPDGPEPWGQWVQDRYYSLEVIQDPLRARMCGFGDKDRRPLAPAAVAKMVVRGEDNKILDVDDLDVDFFLVTVDLWSADAKQEMNLVLHPTPSDRYIPAHARARRRANTASGPPSAFHSRSVGPRPYPAPPEKPRRYTNHPPGPSSFILRPIDPPPSGTTPLPTPTSTQSYSSPGYPFSPQSDLFPSAAATPDTASPWSFPTPVERAPFQAPTLPSIHSLGCTSPLFSPADTPFMSHSDPPDLAAPFRGWPDSATGLFDTHPGADPILRDAGGATRSSEPFPPPAAAAAAASAPAETLTPVLPAPPPQPAFQPFGQRDEDAAAPRHTYTRTLVGPLSANAQRLQDEHRQRGIFFLFQDLSVRTEGTFRLRMRLMNVGAPPAPNALANAVHTGSSPVLAQSFSAPFTVYSAKRFPGVPDTTALSIAFGNQGQKLPLRNRHGPRRRPGTVSSDDESF